MSATHECFLSDIKNKSKLSVYSCAHTHTKSACKDRLQMQTDTGLPWRHDLAGSATKGDVFCKIVQLQRQQSITFPQPT